MTWRCACLSRFWGGGTAPRVQRRHGRDLAAQVAALQRELAEERARAAAALAAARQELQDTVAGGHAPAAGCGGGGRGDVVARVRDWPRS